MIKLIKLFFILLFACSTTTLLMSQDLYQVRTIKMKSDMVSKGVKIGNDYLSGSLKKIGVDNVVLTGMTGNIHVLVITPVPTDDPFINRYAAMEPHMVEMAGSKEKLQEKLKMYGSSVLHQQMNVFKTAADGDLTAPYYLIRFVKFKKGHKADCMKIGMKYFQAANERLGIKSMVLSARSGPWDALILEPRYSKNPLIEPKVENIYDEYLKLAKNKESLNAAMKKFMDGVSNEEIHYFKKYQ